MMCDCDYDTSTSTVQWSPIVTTRHIILVVWALQTRQTEEDCILTGREMTGNMAASRPASQLLSFSVYIVIFSS